MSRYRLSGPAREDIALILAESASRFGEAASERYEKLIGTALVDISTDPDRPGSRPAPDLGASARIYHLRNSRRRVASSAGSVRTPRHFILYRVLAPDLIGVARLLHDSMDFHGTLPTTLAIRARNAVARWTQHSA